MKLRTTTHEAAIYIGTRAELTHDAAAAHALMQAMEDLDHSGWTRYQNPIHAAKCRANELMREWGFTNE